MIYVDGHMMAYWSRLPMHKGKITMLGRIMAGSQAVIAHDETAGPSLSRLMRLTYICLRLFCSIARGGRGNRQHRVCHRPGRSTSVALAEAFE